MLASSWNSRLPLRAAAVAVLIALAGCTQPEIDRPGTWQSTGANERNLRAMLVDPRDARGGSGAITARGDSGSRAVTRLLTDRRRPLLNASVSRVGAPTGDAPSDGAGASPPAAGGAP